MANTTFLGPVRSQERALRPSTKSSTTGAVTEYQHLWRGACCPGSMVM